MHSKTKQLVLFLVVATVIGLVSQTLKNARAASTEKHSAIERTKHLKEPLDWEITGKEILFKFPDQFRNTHISGSVLFLHTSDKSFNKTYHLPAGNGLARYISTEWLKKGEYTMQVNWTAGKEQFYSEGLLSLN